MNNFVENLLLLTSPKMLMLALQSGDYSGLGLTLQAGPRSMLNDHLALLTRNIAAGIQRGPGF